MLPENSKRMSWTRYYSISSLVGPIYILLSDFHSMCKELNDDICNLQESKKHLANLAHFGIGSILRDIAPPTQQERKENTTSDEDEDDDDEDFEVQTKNEELSDSESGGLETDENGKVSVLTLFLIHGSGSTELSRMYMHSCISLPTPTTI